MRLVGYVRVSTRAQVDEGLGLEVQEARLTEYCAGGGHDLVAIHRDEGVSGAADEIDRPGLSAALRSILDGGAEGLLVYRLDRLARQLYRQETVIAQLAKVGRVVLSASEADIESEDPTRVLMRQLLGAVAEYERSIIRARLQGGRRMKASKGGYAYGAPGFGHRAGPERELVADPAEQRALSRMLELHAAGKSLRTIAATLALEGHRPKRSERWHPAVVARLVSRALAQESAA